MTAKTSISPSPQVTTDGAEASGPPSDSTGFHAPATQAECRRPRSSSTQKRSRRPGPQVVAASPLGGLGLPLDSVVVMASDDTRSIDGRLADYEAMARAPRPFEVRSVIDGSTARAA